jgi:hypothetical protein
MMGKNFSRKRVILEVLIMAAVIAAGLLIEHMTPAGSYRIPIRLAVVGSAIAPTLFWIYYLRSEWRERAIGRALMTSQVTTSVVLWWTAIALTTPSFSGKQTGWLVVFLLAFYSYWRLFITLRRNQIRAALKARQKAGR